MVNYVTQQAELPLKFKQLIDSVHWIPLWKGSAAVVCVAWLTVYGTMYLSDDPLVSPWAYFWGTFND